MNAQGTKKASMKSVSTSDLDTLKVLGELYDT